MRLSDPAATGSAMVPALEDGTCQVWWAWSAHVQPTLDRLLDEADRERRWRLIQKEDRDRLTVAAALARVVLARHADRPPDRLRFDRTCDRCGTQHGRPRLADDSTGLRFSISHSGQRVALAVMRTAPVGVDVEEVVPGLEIDALAPQVLSAAERANLARSHLAARQVGFLTYWTRKEALLKATGDGLGVPIDRVEVSGPDAPPALLRWSGPSMPLCRVALRGLHPGSRYVASLAVLGVSTIRVHELEADGLLAASHR